MKTFPHFSSSRKIRIILHQIRHNWSKISAFFFQDISEPVFPLYFFLDISEPVFSFFFWRHISEPVFPDLKKKKTYLNTILGHMPFLNKKQNLKTQLILKIQKLIFKTYLKHACHVLSKNPIFGHIWIKPFFLLLKLIKKIMR